MGSLRATNTESPLGKLLPESRLVQDVHAASDSEGYDDGQSDAGTYRSTAATLTDVGATDHLPPSYEQSMASQRQSRVSTLQRQSLASRVSGLTSLRSIQSWLNRNAARSSVSSQDTFYLRDDQQFTKLAHSNDGSVTSFVEFPEPPLRPTKLRADGVERWSELMVVLPLPGMADYAAGGGGGNRRPRVLTNDEKYAMFLHAHLDHDKNLGGESTWDPAFMARWLLLASGIIFPPLWLLHGCGLCEAYLPELFDDTHKSQARKIRVAALICGILSFIAVVACLIVGLVLAET